jgi:hypothetical protein
MMPMSTGNYRGMPREYTMLSGSKDAYMAASSIALVASYTMGVDADMKGDDRGSAHQNSPTVGYA